jgi:hypothetical protein
MVFYYLKVVTILNRFSMKTHFEIQNGIKKHHFLKNNIKMFFHIEFQCKR